MRYIYYGAIVLFVSTLSFITLCCFYQGWKRSKDNKDDRP